MTVHKKDLPHSTSIQKCTYDDETKDMHITFASGGTHCFKEVEKEDYDGLCNAKSPGSHFHTAIRRVYKSEKVD